ncbi:MAG: family 10 glycosylhydrolase [Candidatus Eisenbacteria bacterium]
MTDSAHRVRTGFAVPDSLRAPVGPFDYLWVVRTAILTPQGVDQVVARAKTERVRGLLVQVVGRGDAYYRSDHLPRAEAMPPGDFDPLDRVVRAAHAEGIEVHAWINCMLAWSAPRPPRDPRHVVNAHPEWIARLKDGRSLHRLTPRQRERLGLEGIFLAPAHPGVRSWVANTAREIVARYPVDGVHLDYIRQPVVAVGWDPTTRARFALGAGVDPARFDRVTGRERARIDSLWLSFRCEQVRSTVREVRDSLHAVRPGLTLSAAVIADTITAERYNAQRWRDWVRESLLDRAFVMCYAQPVQTVLDQLVGVVRSLGPGGRVVPGIAVYNSPPETAAAKIKGARALGFPTLAIYSYDALAGRPGYWDRLRELLLEAP